MQKLPIVGVVGAVGDMAVFICIICPHSECASESAKLRAETILVGVTGVFGAL